AAILSTATLADAARTARVSLRTLKEWLGQDDFRAMLQRARAQVLEKTVDVLVQLNTRALLALGRNLDCGRPPTEVKAAIAVIELSHRLSVIPELFDRMRALEEAQGNEHRFATGHDAAHFGEDGPHP